MTSKFKQTEQSVVRNANFFDENEAYIRTQEKLEIYQLIRLAVTRELDGVNQLLDIGNGGFFNYSTLSIPNVVACDLMLKDEQPAPNIIHKQGSILELPFADRQFDCVLAQNVLHHVTGDSVSRNLINLNQAMRECARVLAPNGKLVLVESTVPSWFYNIVERLAYNPLVRIWPFTHPLTFQYTRHILTQEIEKTKLDVTEQLYIPRGRWVIQYGLRVPTFITPIQALKLVASKPPDPK